MAFGKRLTLDDLETGILQNNRVVLSRAITLVESTLPDDQEMAERLLERVLPYTGNSLRIGITGVPGVGKSTFIEAIGAYIIEQSNRLAVLSVDPSSQVSGGSILGDKTRMETLSRNPHAFIRPSASGQSLGGVHTRTREAMLLCEAAGYNVVFIETVGVGQSETSVKEVTDFFLLLMLAGAGDELQGIKRGIMEMADALIITKADGDNVQASKIAKVQYQNALHLFPAAESGWIPQVATCSSSTGEGLERVWELIKQFENHTKVKGSFQKQRQKQNLSWMYEAIEWNLVESFYRHPAVKNYIATSENEVLEGKTTAITMARKLIAMAGK